MTLQRAGNIERLITPIRRENRVAFDVTRCIRITLAAMLIFKPK